MKKIILVLVILGAMKQLSAQGVGIGTTAPLARLHVADSNVLFTATGAVPVTPGNPPVQGAGRRMLWYPDKAAFRAGYIVSTQWDKDSIGRYSFATGHSTQAKGTGSNALGQATTASGDNSLAVGYFANAEGSSSMALGFHCNARAFSSIATGYYTKAEGEYSTAMGESTVASGYYSTAIGSGSLASGSTSTAMGTETIARGTTSTAMGYRTDAGSNSSTTMGRFTKATGYAATAIGDSSTASGSISFAAGFRTTASGIYATAMGNNTISSGLGSNATGWETIASDYVSVAMGYRTEASGAHSTAIGFSNTASGLASTAMGSNTEATGFISTTMGNHNVASGSASTAMGDHNVASGSVSTAMGFNTAAAGSRATSMGFYTTANGYAGTVVGAYNNPMVTPEINLTSNSPLFIVGNGNDNNDLNNAVVVLKSGYVGIGDGFPQSNLHIKHAAGGGLLLENTNDNNKWRIYSASGDNNLTFYNNAGTEIADIDDATGTFSALSDARYKKDILEIPAVLPAVMQLRPKQYHFNWQEKEEQLQLGFLAQDAYKLFPELVSYDKEKDLYKMNYAGFSTVAIKAVQEQQIQIDELKKQNTELKERLDKLEAALIKK